MTLKNQKKKEKNSKGDKQQKIEIIYKKQKTKFKHL